MKFARLLVALVFVFGVCSAFTSEEKGKGMYMVGVSASFVDSLIYFTDVQFVDSVVLGNNGLLPMREQYSGQLEDFMKYQKGMPNRTCFIYFDENKNRLEKSIKKMKEKYMKDGKVFLKQVDADFKFKKAQEY